MLLIQDNTICTKGTQAIGEALKVNYSLKTLHFDFNFFGTEGLEALLDALQVNGSLTFCRIYDYQFQVNALCRRNSAMHERARESIVCLLALRKMRRIIWIPKEMMMMIGQMLWKTKCDVDAWNK